MSDDKGELVITYREDEGEVDRRRLAGILGVGTTVLVVALVVMLSLGVLAGALGVGIGGFIAEFGKVQTTSGGGGAIYPVLGEQPACSQAPQLKANLRGDVEISEYVAFYKDLPLPNVFNDNVVRINIVADNLSSPIQTSDLQLRLSALNASALTLNASAATENVSIQEFNPTAYGDDNTSAGDATDAYAASDSSYFGFDDTNSSGAPLRNNTEFGIEIPNGGNITIDNGTAAAHQVAFETISLTSVDLFLTFGNQSDFESASGIAERAIQPNERTCQALANSSEPGDANITYPGG